MSSHKNECRYNPECINQCVSFTIVNNQQTFCLWVHPVISFTFTFCELYLQASNIKKNRILWATNAGSNTFPVERCREAHSFINAENQGGSEINIVLLDARCNCLATELWDYPAQNHWVSVVIFFAVSETKRQQFSSISFILKKVRCCSNCLSPCSNYTV